MKNSNLFTELEQNIQKAYEETVTVEEAEKLAAKFLTGQLQASGLLEKADLAARMRKSGVKALKAAIYLEEVAKVDKKPSDVMLQALVDSNKLVQDEQGSLDEAEVERDRLLNYLNIFKDAHIFFRGIAKGAFSG